METKQRQTPKQPNIFGLHREDALRPAPYVVSSAYNPQVPLRVQVLADGEFESAICINDDILIEAGIQPDVLDYHTNKTIKTAIITSTAQAHLQAVTLAMLLRADATIYLPHDAITILTSTSDIDTQAMLRNGQLRVIDPSKPLQLGDITVHWYPHTSGVGAYEMTRYAFVMEYKAYRLLYGARLDYRTLVDEDQPFHTLGTLDTIILDGVRDDEIVQDYVQSFLAMLPNEPRPRSGSDRDLNIWLNVNYYKIPRRYREIVQRIMHTHESISRQEARAYVATHLSLDGIFYEVGRDPLLYTTQTNQNQ